MSDFQRVKDKTTGHKYSVRHADLEKVEVLDEPAVDNNGRPLPPETEEPTTTAPARRKSPAKKTSARAAAKKTPTTGAEPATTPKEGTAS